MTGYDPIKGPRIFGCLYLSKIHGSRYSCLIKSGEIDFNSLSEQVQKYYLQECLDYPNPDTPGHCPPRHYLPEKCGYRIIEAK